MDNVAHLYNLKLWIMIVGIPGFALVLALFSGISAVIFRVFDRLAERDISFFKWGLYVAAFMLMFWLWLFVKNGS